MGLRGSCHRRKLTGFNDGTEEYSIEGYHIIGASWRGAYKKIGESEI